MIEQTSDLGGEVSAVNRADVGAGMIERGVPGQQLARELGAFALDVAPLDGWKKPNGFDIKVIR